MSKAKITETKRFDILSQYNGRCAYCGRFAPLTIDHLVPLCQGGKSSYTNLAPACEDCNQCKDNMTLEQFRNEIALKKIISELNEKLKQPFVRLFSWQWDRTLKRFDQLVEFWRDKH